MREPTLDDAIAALAAVDGHDLDTLVVADFLVDPYHRGYEARAVAYRYDPKVIEEAEKLLRLHRSTQELLKMIAESASQTGKEQGL
jgi:hypothetical protein